MYKHFKLFVPKLNELEVSSINVYKKNPNSAEGVHLFIYLFIYF